MEDHLVGRNDHMGVIWKQDGRYVMYGMSLL